MSIHEDYPQMVGILIERDNLRLQVAALQLQVDELGHINDKQRVALEKYADRDNWLTISKDNYITQGWDNVEYRNNPWSIAQEALGVES